MPDVFSRDLNQDAVDRIDASAANPGLSPNEYLRRVLEEGPKPDLADLSVMEAARR
jgi:hypothetical protein